MTASKAQLDARRQVHLDGSAATFLRMNIGQRIRARRTELGLSLQKVADALGVSKNAVYLWEVSETTAIAIANLLALSEVLEMSVAELLPPKATEGDFALKDEREILLIQQFRLLSEQQKEACLRVALAMSEDQSPNS